MRLLGIMCGCCFHYYLSSAKTANSKQYEKARSLLLADSFRGKLMRVMVVDNELDSLINFFKNIVDDSDVDYKMFRGNQDAALQYARDHSVDIAFLGIDTSEPEGISLCEKLISVSQRLKIVLLSGIDCNLDKVKARLGENFLGLCRKPFCKNDIYGMFRESKVSTRPFRHVSIRAFGSFDLFLDGRAVRFSSAKSKELLALLVEKAGSQLSMGTAIACLWPDKNVDLAKKLYRDAVCRLRLLLKRLGLDGFVEFGRAVTVLPVKNARCDYWDFLSGIHRDRYNGEFMSEYEWAVESQHFLDGLKAL